MAGLIYLANSSLDGYIEDIEDPDGELERGAPDEAVFSFIYNLQSAAGTYLYGRRMYETMRVWETDPSLAAQSPMWHDFAEMWQAADKIVYSRTLAAVSTRKTKMERNFDPAAIRRLKDAAEHDILIGGAEIAAHAFRSGLIDECQLLVAPIILGGRKRSLPDNVRLELELLEERRIGNGTVFLRYRVK